MGLRDAPMETIFGTTLAANGFSQEITTWGFSIKYSLFSVNPVSVGCSLSGFVVVEFGTAPDG